MPARKHYTVQSASELLARLVAMASTDMADIKNKPALARRIQRLFQELLSVSFGDVHVSESVIRKLYEAGGATQWMWLQRLKKVLHDSVPDPDGLIQIGDFRVEPRGDLVLPRVKLVAIELRRGYRFEVDDEPSGLLWLQTLRLLNAVGPDPLQRCDCGAVYVKSGKRKSCSVRCQKRLYMRRYRNGEADKE